ncbi:MAG TPA: GreA/GreB family elongation factor [Flavipsychrobacter sp.]|jgi:regulator of nucleoside diphosphate kinase|nr:GreA/GreB family elongation factor [Flavipsychrobacter sp.]
MKPIISHTDYNTVKSYIANCPTHLKTKEMNDLVTELDRAEHWEDEKVKEDVIQINSSFEVEDTASKKVMKFFLTLPQHADLKQRKISIFSPLGIALIGFTKGMTIKWALPGGEKLLKILNVSKH